MRLLCASHQFARGLHTTALRFSGRAPPRETSFPPRANSPCQGGAKTAPTFTAKPSTSSVGWVWGTRVGHYRLHAAPSARGTSPFLPSALRHTCTTATRTLARLAFAAPDFRTTQTVGSGFFLRHDSTLLDHAGRLLQTVSLQDRMDCRVWITPHPIGPLRTLHATTATLPHTFPGHVQVPSCG